MEKEHAFFNVISADDVHNLFSTGLLCVIDTRAVQQRCFLGSVRVAGSALSGTDFGELDGKMGRERRENWFQHILVLCDEQQRGGTQALDVVGQWVKTENGQKCVGKKTQAFVLFGAQAVERVLEELSFLTFTIEEESAEFVEDIEAQHAKRDRHRLPHKIVRHLYLGDYASATSLVVMRALHITHVINASNAFPSKFKEEGIRYLEVDVWDSSDAQIAPHFDQAVEFVEEARKLGPNHNVLIHCAAGISRSTSLALAYLMKAYHIDLRTAVHLTKSRRKVVCPNSGFLQQLQLYERELGRAKLMEVEREPQYMLLTDVAPVIKPHHLKPHAEHAQLHYHEDTGLLLRAPLNLVVGIEKDDGTVLFFDDHHDPGALEKPPDRESAK